MDNNLIRQALLLNQPENNETLTSSNTFKKNSLVPLTKTQQFFLGKYQTPQQLLLDYTPDRQAPFSRFPQKCLEGLSPTLADIRAIWGGRWAETWLEAQLKDISEYSNSRDKLHIYQLEETARIILEEFYYFKLSELVLFFAHFKAGRYGRFYGSVDPLVITQALQDFKLWRTRMLDYLDTERRALQLQQRPLSPPGTITFSEWQRHNRTILHYHRISILLSLLTLSYQALPYGRFRMLSYYKWLANNKVEITSKAVSFRSKHISHNRR